MGAELKEEYRYYPQRNEHIWIVRGELGAVHISCTDRRKDRLEHENGRADYDMVYGGVECHYGKKPSKHEFCGHHADCWVHDGECWHDGSSLQFQETFANDWGLGLIDGHEWEPFFSLARRRYQTWIVEGEYAEDDRPSPKPQAGEA